MLSPNCTLPGMYNNMIFAAKTCDASRIKHIAELMHTSHKTVCLEIDGTGIHISMTDRASCILYQIELDAHQFNYFHCITPMHIGINAVHWYKMIKHVKRKDTILMFITRDQTNTLGLQVTPRNSIDNRVSTSYITLHNVQNVRIECPVYNVHQPIVIHTAEYQRTLKELCNLSNIVTVRLWPYGVEFSSDDAVVMSRTIQFGIVGADEDPVYESQYYSEHIMKTSIMCAMGSMIRIYRSIPLTFECNVGTIGTIVLCIKSKHDIDEPDRG